MAIDIDTLQIEIEASSNEAAKRVQDLADALANLKGSAKGGAGLVTVSDKIKTLISNTGGATSASNKINKLVSALHSLESVQKPAALSSITNSLNKLNGLDLSGVSTEKMQTLASALNTLGSVQKASGLSSTINALRKLPTISAELEKADLGKFATQMQEVASAMAPLANEMQKVSSGFAAFPIRIQKIISSNAGLAASNQKTAKSFGVLGTGISSTQAKFGIYMIVFRRLASLMAGWATESNKYVEDLNLFNVAMGDGAQAAYDYAQAVHKALGIDPAEWMRNQGVFKQILSGFGAVEEKANLMSKNLTQIGYDISSFFNVSIAESMQKVQSGIAGELEPLRRLGYALDVATLQEIAYKNGINMKVNAMNQAQKSQLRYLAIMEQSGNVMGDMARTVQTPANALRILSQQITQLSRALGNLLIPFLQQVIPLTQAFVEVLTEAIQSLAVLIGFELPSIDYSGLDGISSGATDAEDAMDNATKAAKSLKNATLGIDELNIISPDTSKGAGTSGIGGINDLGIELPEYDFLGGLTEQTKNLKEEMKELLYDYVIPIGAALAAWKILTLLGNLTGAMGLITDLKKALAGALVAYLEFKLVKGAFDKFLSEDGTIWDFVKGALFTALGSGILYMIFGPAGLVVGLGISLVATLVSLGTAIGNGLDYKGFKANLMTAFAGALGGVAGFVLTKSPQGAAVGFLIATALAFNVSSVMAHISGQVADGTKESMLANLKAVLTAGLAGAGIGFLIGGPGGAAIGFVIGASISIIGQEVAIDFGAWYNEISRIVDGVEIFDDSISEATQNAVKPFIEEMRMLDDAFVELKMTAGSWDDVESGVTYVGSIIDQTDVESVKTQLDQIVNTITSTLDSNKNKALTTLEPLAAALGSEKYAEILAANEEYYANVKAMTQTNEEEINSILRNAANEKRSLTESEWSQLVKIQDEMQSIGISNLSETQIEYETIMRNLKDNASHISLEQASEIIKNAQATRDETISAAEMQYSSVLLEAQKMLDAGAINSEQYQAIIDAAKEAKDSTVLDANAQYQSIYSAAEESLGDLLKYIDKNNGEIKSKWDVFWDETGRIFADGWNDVVNYFTVELPKWWSETIAPWFTFEKWAELGSQALDGLFGGLSQIGNKISAWGGNFVTGIKDFLGIHSPSTLFRDEIGYYLGEGIAKGLSDSESSIISAAQSIADSVQKVFNGITYDPGTNYMELINEAKAAGNTSAAAQYESMRNAKISGEGITDYAPTFEFTEALAPATEQLAASNGHLSKLDQLSTVSNELFTAGNTLYAAGNGLSTVRNDLLNTGLEENKNMYETAMGAFSDTYSDFMGEFNNALKTVVNNLSALKSSMMSGFGQTYSEIRQAASRIVASTDQIRIEVYNTYVSSGFASGGFPEHGQMFIAREAGPELVGQIGNRTAVANNGQIEAGIEEAAYRGFMRAMAESQRQQSPVVVENKLYLDGKQLRTSIKQADREAGASIMSGGVMTR